MRTPNPVHKKSFNTSSSWAIVVEEAGLSFWALCDCRHYDDSHEFDDGGDKERFT
jgi:hypothetical protein